jgi:hypothetical protein
MYYDRFTHFDEHRFLNPMDEPHPLSHQGTLIESTPQETEDKYLTEEEITNELLEA